MINGGSKFGVCMNQKKIPCNAMKRPKSKKLFETIILNKVNKITKKLGKEKIIIFLSLIKKFDILKTFKII